MIIAAYSNASVINIQELYSRNSISQLLVSSLFILGIFGKRRPFSNPYFLYLTLFTIIHIWLNLARAAALLLILTLILTLIYAKLNAHFKITTNILLAMIPIIMATVSLSYPIFVQLQAFSWLGGGKAALSAQFRSEANWLLISKAVMDHPLLGMGWNMVLETRSGGYITHTLYLIIFAAYGLLGSVPLLAWFILFLAKTRDRMRVLLAMSSTVIIVSASFVNDPVAWYGLLFALLFNVNTNPNSPWNTNAIIHHHS
jgi:hypothetical protein